MKIKNKGLIIVIIAVVAILYFSSQSNLTDEGLKLYNGKYLVDEKPTPKLVESRD